MQPLNLMQAPLMGASLIEASAGTGKTYTIAALYLRLVLGVGLAHPLRPDQILVVTFTDAATSELKGRIQQRLLDASAVFSAQQVAADPVMTELLNYFAPEQWPSCALLLNTAAQWMDEAAISTIHSFCQRMLTEHAFLCHSQFERALEADQSALQMQVVLDYWRSAVYPLPLAAFESFQQRFNTPTDLWYAIRPLWGLGESAPASSQSLAKILKEEAEQRAEQLHRLKAPWQTWLDEISELLYGGLDAGVIDKKKIRADWLGGWLTSLAVWRDDATQVEPKAGKWQERLTPAGLVDAWKGKPPDHPAFAAIDALPAALCALPDAGFALRQHAYRWICTEFGRRRDLQHSMGFDDLLTQLAQALTGSHGSELAATLRQQFPVSLIDEFQDTDACQWQIFSTIYEPMLQRQDCGLLLIGDPKQAIYSFRGADIFTYLQAKRATSGRHYSLDTNFRSTGAMVAAVNQLFEQAELRPNERGAFLFDSQDQTLPFHPVQAKGRAEQFVLDGAPVPAVHWRVMGDTQTNLSKTAYLAQAAEQAAARIGELLSLAAQQRCGFQQPEQWAPLQPGDIAVLVNNQQEADAIRQALMRLQIASVYLSDKGSVYQSPLASELALWLAACATPRAPKAVRAALASPSMALDYALLQKLADDDNELEAYQHKFSQLQQIWRQRGVLAMLHQLMQEFQLVQQFAKSAQSERMLTDFLHLAELLQQASRQLEGEAALQRYLQQQLSGDQAAEQTDAQKLRLESDDALVKVVTIHKSKGLEYPVVFLPFISAARPLDKKQIPYIWHDDAGVRHIAGQYQHDSFALAERERLAEDLRKLYVALTRARHHCYISVAALKERSAIGYLLAGSEEISSDTLVTRLAPFSTAPHFGLLSATDNVPIVDATLSTQKQVEEHRQSGYRMYDRERLTPWFISSYSAMLNNLQQIEHGIEPLQLKFGETSPAETALDIQSRLRLSESTEQPFAARLRKGAEFGTFLHEQLEWASRQGFAWVLANPQELYVQLATAMQKFSLLAELNTGSYARTLLQEELQRPKVFKNMDAAIKDLADWLLQLLEVQFLPPLCLAGLTSQRAEMEFLLPVAQIDMQLLDALMHAMFAPGQIRPKLSGDKLNGMLKGFIDLTFAHDGRFYVADYKSNSAADGQYHQDNLWQMMLEHRYELQGALYLLALHRLLAVRVVGYQPKRQLGGALYWFLRGANQANAGALLLSMPIDWLLILDQLFLGNDESARQFLQQAKLMPSIQSERELG